MEEAMNIKHHLAADLLFAAFLLPTLIVLVAAVVSLVTPAPVPQQLAAAPEWSELYDER
jgi:hypothetical protein